MRIKKQEIKIGNKMHITDPCYSIGTWCGLFDVPSVAGAWLCSIKKNGEGRVAELLAYHKKYGDVFKRKPNEGHKIGVDSGMVGIFNSGIYPQGINTGEYDDKKTFYGKVCKAMDDDGDRKGYGVIDKGYIASSGYGDGVYFVHLYYAGKKVCGVKVRFIGENS